MARPRKGKALTLRPVRLDEDVWGECQRLGKMHGTINEGMRVLMGWTSPLVNQKMETVQVEEVAQRPNSVARTIPRWKRGPRQKGDSTR